MKRLVLVRHGETEWSRDGRHTGTTDVPLTDAGRRAAEGIAARLQRLDVSPARVVSSPLQRAVDTARLAGLGPDIELDPRLRELDYGDYEGRTSDEIRAERPGWNLFRDGSPGGERVEDAAARAADLLADVAPDEGSGDVVLVGHGHQSRVLAAQYLLLPPAAACNLALGTAALSLLGHEHWWRAILVWNLTD